MIILYRYLSAIQIHVGSLSPWLQAIYRAFSDKHSPHTEPCMNLSSYSRVIAHTGNPQIDSHVLHASYSHPTVFLIPRRSPGNFKFRIRKPHSIGIRVRSVRLEFVSRRRGSRSIRVVALSVSIARQLSIPSTPFRSTAHTGIIASQYALTIRFRLQNLRRLPTPPTAFDHAETRDKNHPIDYILGQGHGSEHGCAVGAVVRGRRRR